MKSIFLFDAMLTPRIITLVYWFLLLAVVVSGLGYLISNFSFGALFTALLIIVGGAIGVRIWCELLIVLFKINDNLKRLADKT